MSDIQSARDDLAFLRGLVGDDGRPLQTFGQAYFVAGLIYGGQMLLHAAQTLGYIPWDPAATLLISFGPTVVFLAILAWIIIANRRHADGAGTASRAVSGLFGVMGNANLVLAAVIGAVAWREHSATTWLIYPCAVFVLQGAAWFFAYMMRRKAWHLIVALGWFACAIAMSLTVTAIGWYILFAGLGLWLCMALPGYAMLRSMRA
ncbi:MAG TPA: hypothetical protein VG387_19240 [Rhizomicrobium sp.]|jgi:hypothetical protein|nr:hypothetical protein [Rhizomicrobium sp.]